MKKILPHILFLLLSLGLLARVSAQAQSRSVTGRVTDRQTGLAIPGVTVLLKGTSNGISTNSEGEYALDIPETEGTLVFSSIGYVTLERAVGSASRLDMSMSPDSKQLSQVVVTALGIERQRKSLGYSVETVENRDFSRASEPNLIRSLQGRLAGVQIMGATGAAGGATRVVIRGAQSFTGDNQPIYVVDGNVISNAALNTYSTTGGDLNNGVDITNRAGDIDPNIVESLTVLKGPAAAALYGARAASGAIIITTKKGQSLQGKPQISVSSAVMFERVNRLPDFQNTFGAGFTATLGPRVGQQLYAPFFNQSWGPRINGQNVADWRTARLRLAEGNPADSVALTAHPNNVRDFFETGVTYNNAVSMAGSNNVSNYYVSVADARTKSFIPNTDYTRTTVSLNGGTRLFDKVTVNGTVNYIKSGGDRGIQGQSTAGIIQSIVNIPRNNQLTDAKDYNDPRYNLTGYHLGNFRNNPYFLLDRNRLTDNVDRVLSTAEASYTPISWLTLTFRQGLDFYSDRRRQQIVPGTINNAAGRYMEDIIYSRNTTTDFLVNVTKQLGTDFAVKGILGTDYQDQSLERNVADGTGLAVPDFYDISNTLNVLNTKATNRTRLFGTFADVQLAYKNYLFLGMTGRNDWTSTLPVGQRSFFYPSANVGFVFTDAFNLQSSVLNFGKLRANAAQVGKPAVAYALTNVFSRAGIDDGFKAQYQFPLAGVPAFNVGNILGNNGLRSEKTRAYEVGTELHFFENRIGFDVTYYQSESKDIIVNVPLSSTIGYTSQTVNTGAMKNQGVELALSAIPVRTKSGFIWDLSLNYTRNRNEVTSVTSTTSNIITGGLGSVTLDAQVGQPYGTFFGTKMLRDPEGRIVVNPATGFPRVDPKRQALGSIQPDYLAGLSTTFSFKGLALNVLFDAKQGGKFYSQTIAAGYFAGTLKETAANDRQPFVIPNSVVQNSDGSYAPNTQIANGGTKKPNGEDLWDNGALYWQQVETIGENLLFDASYVKLREASLSYTLPASLVSRLRLTGIQFSLIGRNLGLWTPKSQPHLDPEVSSFGTGNNQGFEYFSFPTTRSYGASLRLTL
ncbi:SusC/RagA family TonB-linked outer membrane protein [Hymenobacter terrenus]|uniref:SusC/RagA family TonB-linked outer membrane protein n=1 Tax=Hymenobacter terrenus TaxID=1629124 RepID=UPI000619977D|nr:SusC/RagA family TonB-linked outer membrane protein [Hymenobacter terrenus]